jgi:hypothetical protein
VNGSKIEAVKEEDLRATFSDLYKKGRPDATANAIKQARWRALEKMQKAIMQEIVDGVLYVWYPPHRSEGGVTPGGILPSILSGPGRGRYGLRSLRERVTGVTAPRRY